MLLHKAEAHLRANMIHSHTAYDATTGVCGGCVEGVRERLQDCEAIGCYQHLFAISTCLLSAIVAMSPGRCWVQVLPLTCTELTPRTTAAAAAVPHLPPPPRSAHLPSQGYRGYYTVEASLMEPVFDEFMQHLYAEDPSEWGF